MPITGFIALALGVVVAGLAAFLAANNERGPGEPEIDWEARVAVGFYGFLVVGPAFLAQTVFTGLALSGEGTRWLAIWLIAAPLLGITVLAAAVQAVQGPRRAVAQSLAATAQFEMQQAWARNAEELSGAFSRSDSWEPRLTPALPASWPPGDDRTVVWFCYLERAGTPIAVEVAGPWARLTLRPDDLVPVVQILGAPRVFDAGRILTDDTHKMRRISAELIRQGVEPEKLAKALTQWRVPNNLVAADPRIAAHLPPRG